MASRISNKVANPNKYPAALKIDGSICPYGGIAIEIMNIASVIKRHTHSAMVVDKLTRFVIARNSRIDCSALMV